MEADNTLIFVVGKRATKQQIKKEIENSFNAKVKKVNVHTIKSQKRAYVTFAEETPAIDVATDLGVL